MWCSVRAFALHIRQYSAAMSHQYKDSCAMGRPPCPCFRGLDLGGAQERRRGKQETSHYSQSLIRKLGELLSASADNIELDGAYCPTQYKTPSYVSVILLAGSLPLNQMVREHCRSTYQQLQIYVRRLLFILSKCSPSRLTVLPPL